MFEVLIAKGQDLKKLQPVVDMYMDWLNNCEKELTNYLQEQLVEELSVHWMKGIEVYAASIVFNSIDDYGATISFGAECVAGDHIIELYFEKEEIIGNGFLPNILIDDKTEIEFYGTNTVLREYLICCLADFNRMDNLVQMDSKHEYENQVQYDFKNYQFEPSWVEITLKKVTMGYVGIYVNIDFKRE